MVKTKKKDSATKRVSKNKSSVRKKNNHSFEKAWVFWKEVQVDLGNFKFDREEANAR